MTFDNRESQEAQKVRQESEYIKRIEDFALYMGPEYITDNSMRSLIIIAADCLDAKSGKHAMAHVMVGNNRVSRCAMRSMMEESDKFSAMVHDLCSEDGENRSVEDYDKEIDHKQRWLKRSWCAAAVVATWTAAIIVMQVVGIGHWITTVSNLLLMAWCSMLVGRNIMSLREDIALLRQQRKRAAGRQKIVNRITQFADALRQMRAQIEEDAGDDED